MPLVLDYITSFLVWALIGLLVFVAIDNFLKIRAIKDYFIKKAGKDEERQDDEQTK